MEHIKAFLGSSRFLVQIAAALYWIWSVPLRPIRRLISSMSYWAYVRYRALWVKLTHNKYGGFEYWRGGVMIIATAVVIYLIPIITYLTAQSLLFITTQQHEEVYLIQSDEIYPDDNIWSVRGCDRLPCDRESSIYYRIAPTTFNHLWSIVNTGWIFIPDDVGSGVPTGLSRCWVRSYGIRIKTLMRRLDIYPDALEISCSATQGAATQPTAN